MKFLGFEVSSDLISSVKDDFSLIALAIFVIGIIVYFLAKDLPTWFRFVVILIFLALLGAVIYIRFVNGAQVPQSVTTASPPATGQNEEKPKPVDCSDPNISMSEKLKCP